MKIGVIVAVEFSLLAEIYGAKEQIETVGCYRIFTSKKENLEMIFLESGPGEIQAGAGTQFMIDRYCPKLIVNIGLAGGLVDQIKVGDTYIVDGVVHTDYNVGKQGMYPGLKGTKILLNKQLVEKFAQAGSLSVVSCASQDKVIMGDDVRRRMAKDWDCQICDMELAAIGLICLKNKVPLVSMKVVSDTIGSSWASMDDWNLRFAENFKGLATLLRECEKIDKY